MFSNTLRPCTQQTLLIILIIHLSQYSFHWLLHATSKPLTMTFSYQNQAINGGTRHEACLSLRASCPIFLKVKAKVTQSCLTLCDPMDYTVHGILQARTLECVAIPFSRGFSQPRDWTQVSYIAGGFFTSIATREVQEYWSGQPIPSPGALLTQELNQGLLHCRRILYHLSYQGIPIFRSYFKKTWPLCNMHNSFSY